LGVLDEENGANRKEREIKQRVGGIVGIFFSIELIGKVKSRQGKITKSRFCPRGGEFHIDDAGQDQGDRIGGT